MFFKLHLLYYHLFRVTLNHRVNSLESYKAIIDVLNKELFRQKHLLRLPNHLCETQTSICRYKYNQAYEQLLLLQVGSVQGMIFKYRPLEASLIRDIKDSFATL